MAYNILVADDSKVVRTVLEKTLGLCGLDLGECVLVENGKLALEQLRDRWYDLLLTDINMPQMDGMTLVRKMSEDDILKTVPVIVISTEGSEQRIDELRQWGIKGYIRKPFTPEQVKEVVENVLAKCD